jgi:sigma-E factor negative regulatory protein RseA
MKQEISTLMDGELFEDEAESVFDRIKREPDRRKDWEIYHLIGDTLRQPDHIHCNLNAKVRERMADEPVVLAPRRHVAKQKMYAIAWSAAASLAAVGVVGWMSVQITPESVPRMAMRQTDVRPASAPTTSRTDDYLMAHQEFSPSTEMNGGASYIRTASYRDGK